MARPNSPAPEAAQAALRGVATGRCCAAWCRPCSSRAQPRPSTTAWPGPQPSAVGAKRLASVGAGWGAGVELRTAGGAWLGAAPGARFVTPWRQGVTKRRLRLRLRFHLRLSLRFGLDLRLRLSCIRSHSNFAADGPRDSDVAERRMPIVSWGLHLASAGRGPAGGFRDLPWFFEMVFRCANRAN